MSHTDPEPGPPGSDSEPAGPPGVDSEPAGSPEPPPLIPIRSEGYLGGARLLAADIRVASLFADEARRRTMERLFGIPRSEKSGLVTLLALLALGEATKRRTDKISSPSPTLPGVMVGVALVRELAYDIAGPWSRETPFFGTLMAWALIGGATRMAVRGSTRRVRRLSHQGFTTVAHRYGHLVRPNRPRPAK